MLDVNSQHYVIRSKTEISHSMYAWVNTVTTNNSSVSERILSEDFSWDHDGAKTKADAVAEAAGGPYDWRSSVIDFLDVNVVDERANATGSITWEKNDGNKGRMEFVTKWRLENSCWRMFRWDEIEATLLT